MFTNRAFLRKENKKRFFISTLMLLFIFFSFFGNPFFRKGMEGFLAPTWAEAQTVAPPVQPFENPNPSEQIDQALINEGSDFNPQLRVLINSDLKGRDGSRITFDLGLVDISTLGKNNNYVNENLDALKDHILPPSEHSEILLVVPDSLTKEQVETYLKWFRETANLTDNTKIKLKTSVIDIAGFTYQANEEIKTWEDAARKSQDPVLAATVISPLVKRLTDTKNYLVEWKKAFTSHIKDIINGKPIGLKRKQMFIGTVIGLGKSSGSVSWWIGNTGYNIQAVLQSAMSIFLDVFFATQSQAVNNWKAEHRIRPIVKYPRLGKILNPILKNPLTAVYNETVTLKTFVINTLIGSSCGFYFRFMSWMADPSGKVAPPWSNDFFLSLAAGISMGGVIGAAGDQGVRTLRHKGYLGQKTEYFLYQLFGLGMQIGGFLQGSGMTKLFWTYLYGEMAFKSTLYAASKLLPNLKQPLIVFHSDIQNSAVEDFKYRLGVYDARDIHSPQFNELLTEDLKRTGFFDRFKSVVQIFKKWKVLWAKDSDKDGNNKEANEKESKEESLIGTEKIFAPYCKGLFI